MMRPFRKLWKHCQVLSVIVLVTMALFGGCSSRGPIPVEGVVTGKHQTPPKGNPSEGSEQHEAHYFLWVKTEDGTALVEVPEDVFQSVAEGEQVCINCGPEKP